MKYRLGRGSINHFEEVDGDLLDDGWGNKQLEQS
jgi:hypothetical protein